MPRFAGIAARNYIHPKLSVNLTGFAINLNARKLDHFILLGKPSK